MKQKYKQKKSQAYKSYDAYLEERLLIKSCTDCKLYNKCTDMLEGKSPSSIGIYTCKDYIPSETTIRKNYELIKNIR